MTALVSEPATVSQTVQRVRRTLVAAGIAGAELDARLLVGHAAALDRVGLIAESRRPLDGAILGKVDALVSRRIGGEPVGRILGRREFWGLDFVLGPDTLEPRPDTETLVEAALDWIDARAGADRPEAGLRGRAAPYRLADLGTGTGCILVALLSELRGATGIGVDISASAVAVAKSNAECHGVADRARFVVGSWTAPLRAAADGAGFDLIVANPPYIETDVCRRLDAEVRDFDPALALDGGPDGLDAYRAILAGVTRLLAPGGALILELGAGQADAVTRMAEDSGLAVEAVRHDISSIKRALVATLAPECSVLGRKSAWNGVPNRLASRRGSGAA